MEVAAGTGVKLNILLMVNAKSGSLCGCHLGCRKTAHFKVCVCKVDVPGLGDVTFSVAPRVR